MDRRALATLARVRLDQSLSGCSTTPFQRPQTDKEIVVPFSNPALRGASPAVRKEQSEMPVFNPLRRSIHGA